MFIPSMMLAVEANGVVTLRVMKLMSGDSDTLHEAHLMFSEKIDAGLRSYRKSDGRCFWRPNSSSLSAACRSKCEEAGQLRFR